MAMGRLSLNAFVRRLIFGVNFLAAAMELCLGSTRAHGQAAGLPFSSEETTGTLRIAIRHRLHWNWSNGDIAWDRLDVDLGPRARLELAPGSFNPRAKSDQRFQARLTLRDGTVTAEPILRAEDETWRTAVTARLEPRDLTWRDPRLILRSLSLDGDFLIDSRAREGPVRLLEAADVGALSIGRLEAGVFRLADLELVGRWRTPDWTVERFQADVFGGHLRGRGEGRWGTSGPPRVSLWLSGEAVDVRELLRSFNVPRWRQIWGKVGGTARVDVEGGHWRLLDFDLVGQEGTVLLDRRLLYDILAPSFGSGLTRRQVDEALNRVFGNAAIIPFSEMTLRGNMTPRWLHMSIPLHNDALALHVEPRVERPVLDDIWKALVEAGTENIRGLKIQP